MVLEERLLSKPEPEADGVSGMTCARNADGLCCLYDGRVRQRHRCRGWGVSPSDVLLRLERDEAIFNIADPRSLVKRPLLERQQEFSCLAAEPLQARQDDEAPSTLTYCRKKKFKTREQAPGQGHSLEPESLDPAYADAMRDKQISTGIPAKKTASR